MRLNARCRRKVSRSLRQMLEQEGWRIGDERWDTLFEERERKSGDGWSAGVNNDRVNGGGILSTEADRISRKPRAGDKGHVDVGQEFHNPGTVSREFSNPAVFMTSWVLADKKDIDGESLPNSSDSVFSIWTWRANALAQLRCVKTGKSGGADDAGQALVDLFLAGTVKERPLSDVSRN